MLKRLHRAFLIVSALGYGLLGGGPSLWALGLAVPEPVCSMAGCTCHAHGHKPGEKCCCAMNRALLKKFPELAKDPAWMKLVQPAKTAPLAPGASAWSNAPCGGDGSTTGLPLLSWHLATPRFELAALDAQARACGPAAPACPEFFPAPLDRPPRA